MTGSMGNATTVPDASPVLVRPFGGGEYASVRPGDRIELVRHGHVIACGRMGPDGTEVTIAAEDITPELLAVADAAPVSAGSLIVECLR